MNYIPNERATPIRQPSTANLMIDSVDRDANTDSPWDFQITKQYSILNGFFTRVGTTEVVLEWCQPNITALADNNQISFDISGVGGNTYTGNQTVTMPSGNYTVAQALTLLCQKLTDLSGTTGCAFSTGVPPGSALVAIICVGGKFRANPVGKLATQLGLASGTSLSAIQSIICPDLRPYRYIDFTSSQLTYNQDVKDSSSAVTVRDVLCRWYFDWDTPPQLDSLGFPILMGYTPFYVRRLFNPPKQIKWNNSQPIGNLAFQVYGDDGNLIWYSIVFESNWLMTLQVSEV